MATVPQNEVLIKHLGELLQVHRAAFGQERVYLRVVGMVMGEIMTFTRHTVTQVLVAMGLARGAWNGWYRLFSRGRFVEAAVAVPLFREMLRHLGPDEVYVVGGDGTQIARDSQQMEGSSWLKCPRNPPFKHGIHRAQRFFNGAWLMPPEAGYSRALPLWLLPAFTPKAVRQQHDAVSEGEAGLVFMRWVRAQLDAAGLGDKQCWNPHAAVSSVQWSAWVYALLVLAGYRTFGLCSAPPLAPAWWSGAHRWSWPRLLNHHHAALLTDKKYTPC